jgi:hypothetical protein
MEDHSRPSLTFRIVPSTHKTAVGLTVHVPNREAGDVPGKQNLLVFAAVMVRLKIEALRQARIMWIAIDERQFANAESVFNSSWEFVNNTIRPHPLVKAGYPLKFLAGSLRAKKGDGRRWIELNLANIPSDNIVFSIIDRAGIPHTPRTDAELVSLFEFLVGHLSADELFTHTDSQPVKSNMFMFGNKMTGTFIVHDFPNGLDHTSITCSLTGKAYAVPPEIEVLIDRAHTVIQNDAPGVQKVTDQPMLAPCIVDLQRTDLDSGNIEIAIRFSDSSYRYYAAFAFAELLARYSDDYAPLLSFVQDLPDPNQPGPATCSMGVRVLLETADNQIIVAYRSDEVKLNPNVWTISANEGIRSSLLVKGRNCPDLLTLAVYKALKKELCVHEHECHQPLLLSLYRNQYNQWGAGFAIKTDLAASEVIAQQKKADHCFEHGQLATLPIEVHDCGQAMRNLGERWYGGALETLCQFLAWKQLGDGAYKTADQIAAELSTAAGGVIQPSDQPKLTMVPAPPEG